MPKFDFDKASMDEINAQVAYALSWQLSEDDRWLKPQWVGSPYMRGILELPNWANDDGMAFKHLWPEMPTGATLRRLEDGWHVITYMGKPDGSDGGFQQCDLTASRVLCRAFLTLKGVI